MKKCAAGPIFPSGRTQWSSSASPPGKKKKCSCSSPPSPASEKTAQRIALELKDKISQADVSAAVPAQTAAAPALSPDAVTEAIEAMIALGYSSTEARNAISQVRDQTDKPEELIRLALRAMAGF